MELSAVWQGGKRRRGWTANKQRKRPVLPERGCAESRAGAMDVPQRQGLFLRGKTSRDLSDWRQLSQVERAGGPQEEKPSRGSASSRASRARGGQARELGFLSRSRVNPGGLQAGPLLEGSRQLLGGDRGAPAPETGSPGSRRCRACGERQWTRARRWGTWREMGRCQLKGTMTLRCGKGCLWREREAGSSCRIRTSSPSPTYCLAIRAQNWNPVPSRDLAGQLLELECAE